MPPKNCARCEKQVYPVDELKCLDKLWHKGCFKCQVCGMTLNMKNYKGFEKQPYCVAHYPEIKHTQVAETPESKRIAENTKIQSQIKYHEDFEKNKGTKISVADDPETTRARKNMQTISQVVYHGELGKKQLMEDSRPSGSDGQTPSASGCPPPPQAFLYPVTDASSAAAAKAGLTPALVSPCQPQQTPSSPFPAAPPPTPAAAAALPQQRPQPAAPQAAAALQRPAPAAAATVQPQRPSPAAATALQRPAAPAVVVAPQRPAATTAASPSQRTAAAAVSPPQRQPPASLAQSPTKFGPKGRMVKALYDYKAADTDEVTFREADVIILCDPIDDGWLMGTVEKTSRRGMLPANYVSKLNW